LHSEFQIICASTKDLETEVEEGRFVIDLLMRITGINVELAPLRDRKGDIPQLVKLFLTLEEGKVSDRECDRIIEKCQSLYWQGNVRQLKKAVSTMVMNASLDDSPISADFMPVTTLMRAPKGSNDFLANRYLGQRDGFDSELADLLLEPLTKDCDFSTSMASYEKYLLRAATNRHKKISDLCNALNIARSSFDEKKKRHGL
jgi:DNA-binding NtrC family response regulator